MAVADRKFERGAVELAAQIVFEYEGWGSEHVEEMCSCGDFECDYDEVYAAAMAIDRLKADGKGYDECIEAIATPEYSMVVDISELNHHNAKRTAKRMGLTYEVVCYRPVANEVRVSGKDEKQVQKFVRYYDYNR